MSSAVNLWLALMASEIGFKCVAQIQVKQDWIKELDRINKAELDKEWREYVDKLGGEYEEKLHTTPIDEDDPKYLKEFLDWNPTSPREIPFLAILWTKDSGPSAQYKEYFKGDPEPGANNVHSHIEPGTACGGALLSPRHVITMCGCLSYLITDIFRLPELFPNVYDHATPKYNIWNHVIDAHVIPNVYITFSMLRFVPDMTYQVDTDTSKWHTGNDLNCKRLLLTAGHTPNPDKTRARRADGELVVVPFKPDAEVGSYPLWPPKPINKNNDRSYNARVVVASIGMRLTEKTKLKFHSSVQVSSLELKHCNIQNDVCNPEYVYDAYDGLHPCFCPITTDQQPQIVGGVIGWPVVNANGTLVGLTCSERLSADGTLAVSMITDAHIKLIEKYIGKHVLESQNIKPIVYRETDLNKDWMIYDYLAAQFRTPTPRRPSGKSGATTFGNIAFNFFFPYLAWPFFT